MRYECLTCAFSCHSWRTITLHGDSSGHGDCYDYDLEYTRVITSWDTYQVDLVPLPGLTLAPRGF